MRTRTAFLLWTAFAALLCAPLCAHADANVDAAPPVSTDELRADMHRYLAEEKRGGAVLMGIGLPAVALGGGLLLQDAEIGRGFAYPVLVMGALEFFGGLLFYARTNRMVQKLDRELDKNPQVMRNQELARMRRINVQFKLIEVFELALLLSGIGMSAGGAATRNDTLLGVGLGLSVESASLLTFDLFASKRALRYTGTLLRWQF